ncbi:MAG TPA: hypothetical protein VEB67_01290 [Nitrososphaerales archaeon]|nr:hypothetical protein [Nitrososphaerales archaeon]
MNTGMLVTILGILGIVVGGAMYAIPFHKDIGLGGLGLGVVLLIVGLWMSRKKPMAPAATPTAP